MQFADSVGGYHHSPSRSRSPSPCHSDRLVRVRSPYHSDSEQSDSEDSSSEGSEGEAGEEKAQPDAGHAEAVWSPDPTAIISVLQGIGAVFSVFQLECCPETGRRHVQGYVRFSKPVRMGALQRAMPGGHFESAKAQEDENIKYCTKDESRVDGPWTFGESARPGKRSDISTVRDLVSAGAGMRNIIEEVNSYQAIRCAEVMLKYKEPGRKWKPEVRWYYGSTGSGKTRSAVEEFPNAWVSARNLKWWEGYDAHEVVIVDDFRRDFCTFHELLRILDRYEYRVETKGGSRQLLAKVIVVTCPWSPAVLYESRGAEDVGQLVRRIDEQRLFGEEVPMPAYGACAPGFQVV